MQTRHLVARALSVGVLQVRELADDCLAGDVVTGIAEFLALFVMHSRACGDIVSESSNKLHIWHLLFVANSEPPAGEASMSSVELQRAM